MSLTSGTRLGPYEIQSSLGAGGMGEVYRARDTRLDRSVAIKVLPAHLASDKTAVGRFEREARAVAALSHPNILALFDVGTESGVAFVVTELLEGETVRARVQRGALGVREVLTLGGQAARGLAAAHEKGIVHRDLKPENLFITHHGLIKILDFGLAQVARQADGQSFAATIAPDTTPGTVLGTVGYMSPEQVRGQDTDHRTDIFAMGAVLYEMLAGRRAFNAESAADTMAAIVRDTPRDLSQLNPSLPPGLARIISRCLEKDLAARFQSAHDLAFALESLSQPQSASGAESIPMPAHSDQKSIVVLPFEDLSPERDNEYFADGLSDEIISDLSKIAGLQVISRNSSMQLKARARDIAVIARDLRVRYVLDGSVRKAGNKLRIVAQLVDATTNTQVWSDKYSGTLDDIFEIQEQVARAIATELKGKLSKDESQALARRPIADARAYELYLRARAKTMTFSVGALQQALGDIEAALAISPDNVQILATLGEVHWQFWNIGVVTDRAVLQKVLDLASRVEALEPGSNDATRLRALVAVHSGDMQEATRQMKVSLASDPNDPFACMVYAFGCLYGGRGDAAIDIGRRLLALDPLNIISRLFPPWCDYFGGRLETAARGFAEAYEAEPEQPPAVLLYVQALAALGRDQDASAIVDRLAGARPDDKWTTLAVVFRAALKRDTAAFDRSLTDDFVAWCGHDPQYTLLLAESNALLGRHDQVFRWLEQLMSLGGCPFPYVAFHCRFFEDVRSDRRWAPLMERMRAASERFEV